MGEIGDGSLSLAVPRCVSTVWVCRACSADGEVCLRVEILGRERGSSTFLSPRAGASSKSDATTNPWMGDGYMGGDQGSCIVCDYVVGMRCV